MSATRAQIRQSIARSVREGVLLADDRGSPLCGAFPGAQLDAGDGPRWNTLMPRGKWHGANLASVGGSIDLTDAYFAEMIANWQGAGKPRLPIRKTHLHLQKDDPELQASYGSLTDFRIGATGLETLTDWTDNGRAEVRSGRFASWSPEWYPTHVDRRTGEKKGAWLSGTALTNDPFFISMPPVAASAAPTPQDRSNTMNEEQLKALRAKLGLAADATPEQCIAAANKAGAVTAAVQPNAEAITAAVAPVKAQVDALTASLATREKQVDALTASLLERDVTALVATAKRGDGKNGRAITDKQVALAQKLAKSDGLTAATEFLNELPLNVPIAAVGQAGTTDAPLTAAAASEKLKLEAEKLSKDGNTTPWLSALARNPELALLAQGGK